MADQKLARIFAGWKASALLFTTVPGSSTFGVHSPVRSDFLIRTCASAAAVLNSLFLDLIWTMCRKGLEVQSPTSALPHRVAIRTAFDLRYRSWSRTTESPCHSHRGAVRGGTRTIEFGWGEFNLVGADNNRVMAHRCDWRGNSVLALHNLSDESCEVGIELEGDAPKELNDVLSDKEYSALTPAARRVRVQLYGYRWLRLAGTRR